MGRRDVRVDVAARLDRERRQGRGRYRACSRPTVPSEISYVLPERTPWQPDDETADRLTAADVVYRALMVHAVIGLMFGIGWAGAYGAGLI